MRLQPMRRVHLDDLTEAGKYEELWRWTSNKATTRDAMSEYMEAALAGAADGNTVPWRRRSKLD